MNISEAMDKEVGTQFSVKFKSGTTYPHKLELSNKNGDVKFKLKDGTYVVATRDLVNAEFTVVSKPATFRDVLSSDTLCRVEHELFKQNEFTLLSCIFSEILKVSDNNGLKQIIKNGTWYTQN